MPSQNKLLYVLIPVRDKSLDTLFFSKVRNQLFAFFCTILTPTAYIWDLGLITFRIAMVLRTLRILENGDYSNPLVCNETDFQTEIQIAFTLENMQSLFSRICQTTI